MKGDAKILIGVAVTGAAFAGLLLWGSRRAKSGPPQEPLVIPAGMFPDLKLGDLVLVDAVKGRLPPPFDVGGLVLMQVDFILTDKFLVSVANVDPRFSGVKLSHVIERGAIFNVVPRAPVINV